MLFPGVEAVLSLFEFFIEGASFVPRGGGRDWRGDGV